MFRPRRPFRPGPRRSLRRLPLLRPRRRPPPRLARRMSPIVAEIERLMQGGQFQEAAARFRALAQEAEKRGRIGGAGELYLRAARCYVDGGDVEEADDCAERAIHLLIKARRPNRVRQVLPKVLAALERHGRHEDAERLRAEVEAAFRGRAMTPTPVPEQAAARLPAKCSACGAPLRPDEVAWTAPARAECPYCGSVVKAE